MKKPNRIQEYLQRLTPLARNNLLTELERLELCGAEIPGAEPIVEKLRAEFRAGGDKKRPRGKSTTLFFSPRWNHCWWMARPNMPIRVGSAARLR